MNFSYVFLGMSEISVCQAYVAPMLDLCRAYCIPYTDLKGCDDGGITFCVRLLHEKKLLELCRRYCIEACVCHRRGLPILLSKYKHRYGLLVGALCALAIIFMSQRYVWDIRISGNEHLTASEVSEILEKYGLRVGSYIPSLNTDKIENRLLMNSDELSWISVNITGNIAEVEIREKKMPDDARSTKFANLVASKPGVVEQVQIYKGNVVVRSGEYVKQGQLLVSGIYDSERIGFRFTRASGQVIARTVSEYSVKIPLEYEEKVYTGRVNYEKNLNFFGFSFNISKKCGNHMVFYDTINIVENCSFPDGVGTPLEINTVKYLEYENKVVRRTYEEAEELAYFKLAELMGQEKDRVVLRKIITPTITEDSVILKCTLVCLEDIAKLSEFEVDLSVKEDTAPQK